MHAQPLHLIVGPDANLRCDLYLAKHVPGLSRRQARQLLREGCVRCNGQKAHPSTLVTTGQQLVVTWPQPRPLPAQMPHEVQRNDDLIFAFKPRGWHTVAHRVGDMPCLSTWLDQHVQTPMSQHDPLEAGALHRLDCETSGVVAFARHPSAFAQGRLAMAQHHSVRKAYVALSVAGVNPTGLSPVPTTQQKWQCLRSGLATGERRDRVQVVRKGPAVESLVHCLWQGSHAGREFRLWDLRLIGGFRHQLRVHLAAFGWPIFGDPLYGPPAPLAPDCPAQRTFLLAYALDLRQPFGHDAAVICLDDLSFWQPVAQIIDDEKIVAGAQQQLRAALSEGNLPSIIEHPANTLDP